MLFMGWKKRQLSRTGIKTKQVRISQSPVFLVWWRFSISACKLGDPTMRSKSGQKLLAKEVQHDHHSLYSRTGYTQQRGPPKMLQHRSAAKSLATWSFGYQRGDKCQWKMMGTRSPNSHCAPWWLLYWKPKSTKRKGSPFPTPSPSLEGSVLACSYYCLYLASETVIKKTCEYLFVMVCCKSNIHLG